MGVCSSKQNNQRIKQNQSLKIPNFMLQLEKQTGCKINKIVVKNSGEPKEYDHNNPHRQYNVLLNGTLFAVINSIEGSLEEAIENN